MLEPNEVTSLRPTPGADPGPALRSTDRHLSAAAFTSGKAVHYCAREFFTRPVNIERLVAATPNAEYACPAELPPPATPSAAAAPAFSVPPSECEPGLTGPPCTGLDTGEVSDGMARIA